MVHSSKCQKLTQFKARLQILGKRGLRDMGRDYGDWRYQQGKGFGEDSKGKGKGAHFLIPSL